VNLRASLEALEEQMKIMTRNKSILEMGSIMTYSLEEETES
jgi:hypothetical protein